MSYSAGTFSINSAGQPVVSGTTISSSAFNALTADLATGLSTAMLKDGTQTATAGIGFYAGTVSLPGITFGTDTATGLYRIALNNTGLAINGTKLLDLSSALVGITGAVTISTTLGVTGITTLAAALVGGTTQAVFNTVSTTVNAFGAATALNLGGDTTIWTPTTGTTITLRTATATTLNLFNTVATTVNLGGAATTIAMGAGASTTLTVSATTAVALNTAAITSNQTTVALLNATATTVNFAGGASTALNIGHASGTMNGLGNWNVGGTLGATGALSTSAGLTIQGRFTQNLSTPVASEYALRSTGQTTGWIAIDMANNGGSYIFAGENSTGNNIIIGDTAYDLVVRGPSGISFSGNAGSSLHMRIASTGAVTIPGTLALTATASPTGTGTGAVGQIAWDTAYLYICTATNDWRRIALVDF